MSTTRNPTGILPALSTPTDKSGELDETSLRSLVNHNIDWGVDGLALSIVAGEFYKFSDEERRRLFEVTVDEANGRVPVWAGVNHMGTEPAVRLARQAKEAGASGVIALPPFVGTKTDGAAFEHFTTLIGRIDLPVMVQDAEDFTGVHLGTSLYVELAKEHSNLSSIKIEGGETLKKMADVLKIGELQKLSILGGMGGKLLLQELELGTHGSIPGSCLTDIVVEIYQNQRSGQTAKAKEVFGKYKQWLDILSLNSSSSAEVQKETARLRGVIKSSHTRSPHVPLGEDAKRQLASLVDVLCGKETT